MVAEQLGQDRQVDHGRVAGQGRFEGGTYCRPFALGHKAQALHRQPTGDGAVHQRGLDRLGDEVVHAGGDAAGAVLAGGGGGHGQYAQAGQARVGADVAGRFQAVHQRHLHVHQHAVEGGLAQQVERFLAVGRQAHRRAHVFQHLQRDLLVEGVVLHQQDAGVLERGNDGGGLGGGQQFGGGVLHPFDHLRHAGVGNAQPRGEPERAAHARLAAHAHLAAHQLRQLLADGQAEAGAAMFARGGGVGLLERLEQAVDFQLREADAAVAHFEAQQATAGVGHHLAHAHVDAALFAELDGVVGVVDQHLPQAQRIAAQHARQRRVEFEDQFQLAADRPGRYQCREGLDHVVECEIDLLDIELAGLDLRDVEDVVDDAQQVFAGEADLFQVVALAWIEVGLERQVGHADHAVHRGADLVAHVGQELALVLARFLGLVARLFQLAGAHQHPFLEVLVPFAQLVGAALAVADVGQAHHHQRHGAAGVQYRFGVDRQPAHGALWLGDAHHHVAYRQAGDDGQAYRVADAIESAAVLAHAAPQAVAFAALLQFHRVRQHARGGGVALQDGAAAIDHHQAVGDRVEDRRQPLARQAQRILGGAARRDIGEHGQRAGVVAGVGTDDGGREQAPQRAAVGAAQADIALDRFARQVALQVLLEQQAAGVVHELGHAVAHHLVHVHAQHGGHGGIDEGGAVVGVGHPDAFGGGLHDQAVALGAGVHGFLGTLALGHVAQGHHHQLLAAQVQRRQVHHGREGATVGAVGVHHPARQAGAGKQFACAAGAAHAVGRQLVHPAPGQAALDTEAARAGRIGVAHPPTLVGDQHGAGRGVDHRAQARLLVVGALGDVGKRAHGAQRSAVGGAFDNDAARQQPLPAAVAAAHAVLDDETGVVPGAGRQVFGHVAVHARHIVGMDVGAPLFDGGRVMFVLSQQLA